MKTLKLFGFVLFSLLALPAWATGVGGDAPTATTTATASLFEVDEAAVYGAVSDLSELEQFVKQNEGTTLADLQQLEHPMVANMQFSAPGFDAHGMMEPPMGIPSIIWGLCLNWVGLLIVHVSEHDKSETKKALIGCIISSVLWGGGYAGFLVR